MDYRELLKKYMRNVGDHEGSYFVYPPPPEPRSDGRNNWTHEEWVELQSIVIELDNE